MKESFSGFQESKKRFTGIPDQFFSEILTEVEDIVEMKLTLYVLWSAYKHGDFGSAFTYQDFMEDKLFMHSLGGGGKEAPKKLHTALQQAVQDGILIEVREMEGDEVKYFINSPRGRTAASLAAQGKELGIAEKIKTTLNLIQPNIYRLYEENIGPLTPLIAEALRDAEDSYPLEWIEEAVEIAVKNNVRRWKYIETILERWQEEGRDGTHQRNDQEDYRRYLKGEYGEIGKP